MELTKLKQIQEKANVKILYGYTPKISYVGKKVEVENVEEKLRGELEYEMRNGWMGMLPGFIGELIITDTGDKYQQAML